LTVFRAFRSATFADEGSFPARFFAVSNRTERRVVFNADSVISGAA
jgi:hypothetical protein